MFGVTPKTEWERLNPCDHNNRIPLGCQSLLLQETDGSRIALVDAGLGEKLTHEESEALCLEERPSTGLLGALEGLGVAPSDITDVIVTHLHFDHAGGLTYRGSDGILHPTFASARHWVQARHLDWARSETGNSRGAFPSENTTPLVKHDLFSLVRGPEQLFRGLRVIPVDGHTRGMQTVLIDGNPPLFYPSDLFPIKSHLRPDVIMAYDDDPLTTLREKQRLLEQASSEGWWMAFQHEPDPCWGPMERFRSHASLGMP